MATGPPLVPVKTAHSGRPRLLADKAYARDLDDRRSGGCTHNLCKQVISFLACVPATLTKPK